MLSGRYVHIFFLDGVGLGDDDPAVNPFATAITPTLDNLFGRNDWYVRGNGRIEGNRGTLIPTDANLGMAGKPQSASGQAAILTGRNVPLIIGEHYGPKPNKAVAETIHEGTLFHEVAQAGGTAALITPYPQGYFDAIDSGRRLYSSVPLAVTSAGYPLFSVEELKKGQAVSPGFTGQGWHDFLGSTAIPLLSFREAGTRIASIAGQYNLSFFEHWPSDRSGHRGPLADAAEHLGRIDAVLEGLFSAWDDENGLLIITSDHGNIEEKDHRQHTRNPVPTILVGSGHEILSSRIKGLDDIAAVVRTVIGLN